MMVRIISYGIRTIRLRVYVIDVGECGRVEVGGVDLIVY